MLVRSENARRLHLGRLSLEQPVPVCEVRAALQAAARTGKTEGAGGLQTFSSSDIHHQP